MPKTEKHKIENRPNQTHTFKSKIMKKSTTKPGAGTSCTKFTNKASSCFACAVVGWSCWTTSRNHSYDLNSRREEPFC